MGENFSDFKRTELEWGATSLPVAAGIEYKVALESIAEDDAVAAEEHLRAAIELDPAFADAYFTLSRIKFTQFNADALYYLVRGFAALWNDFSRQSLVALNALAFAILLLALVSAIVAVAFALRYLPFVAHRLAETLRRHTGASGSTLAAYALLIAPFVVYPGIITALALVVLMTWHFMHRRERAFTVALIVPWIALGIFSSKFDRLTPVAQPDSFVSLLARANTAAGDQTLIDRIQIAPAPGLEAEKHNALGLLELRQENYSSAANHFLRAISLRPADPVSYINLGNVYFAQGQHEKALEGYRKAESIDPTDPVGQYNLAQAYIQTLLMAESSDALQRAAAAGIEKVKQSYAAEARPRIEVYDKTYGTRELWRIAGVEGAAASEGVTGLLMAPLCRFSPRVNAGILAIALILTLWLSAFFKRRSLAFQCSNCGELTCDHCCNDERGTYLCATCGKVIEGMSSEKVVEALLRQRRQAVVVRRRKTVRWLTVWIPGVRDVFYGRLARGVALSAMVSLSAIVLWSRGLIIDNWNMLDYPTPLWKWIVAGAGIFISYAMAIGAKHSFEMRNYRTGSHRQRTADEAPPAERRSA